MLDKKLYFVNNPIVIDLPVTNNTVSFSISVTNMGTGKILRTKLYANPNISTLQYDLSPIISALFKPTDANFANGVGAGVVIKNQIIDVSINIISNTNNGITRAPKNYRIKALRGGEFNTDINIGFNEDINLNLTYNIPIWEGFPLVASATRNLSSVNMLTRVPNYKNMPTKSCNGLYVMFQNIKGGYSAWLFSDYSIKTKTSNTDVIGLNYDIGNRKSKYKTIGVDASFEIDVFDRVDKEYYPYLFSLMASPDIWIYNLNNPASGLDSNKWEQVINTGQSSNIKIEDHVTDFSIKLEYLSSINTKKTW